jgi:hypothetical protein
LNANFRAKIDHENVKDFANEKERYLRKRNEKIVTAYKLALVMLGLNNKAALPSPPVVEETTSNSMNRVLEMKNQDIPKKGVLVEKAPLMATLL